MQLSMEAVQRCSLNLITFWIELELGYIFHFLKYFEAFGLATTYSVSFRPHVSCIPHSFSHYLFIQPFHIHSIIAYSFSHFLFILSFPIHSAIACTFRRYLSIADSNLAFRIASTLYGSGYSLVPCCGDRKVAAFGYRGFFCDDLKLRLRTIQLATL